MMDFEFSPEQEELRHAAQALLTRYCSRDRIRQSLASPDPFDRELWAQMVDLGWLGLDLPIEDGGVGGGLVEITILLEEIGRQLAPVPYLPTLLALAALHGAGEAALVARLLAGDGLGAAVWDRQLGVGAAEADIVIKAAPDQLTVLDHIVVSPEPAMDATRTVGWVNGEGRRIGDAAASQDLLDRATVGTSALLLGGASRVMEMSVQYARERRQFGRPIGSFQAVKHHCADMLVAVEGMRSVVYWAAWCVDAGHPDAPIAASAAKVWCADAGPRVIATGLQIHGGVGFTWDHDLHLYLKRAKLDEVTFGSSSFHRDRLATMLRSRLRSRVPLT